LCGAIHPVKFISYPVRNVRSPDDGKDHTITILCLFCFTAKQQGKQYTKRILPEFLRPYCRIRLDLSISFYAENYSASGNYNYEKACTFLGCIDKRTARRHIGDIHIAVPEINLTIKEMLVHKPGFYQAEDTAPDTPPIALLDCLLEQVREYNIRLYGNIPALDLLPYSIPGIVHWWFCGRDISMTCVSSNSNTHDTS
jgi:hypothetical protein